MAEFQDMYDQAGRTFTLLGALTGRAAIRDFIKYLAVYEQDQRKKGNPASGPEGLRPGGNGELRTCERLQMFFSNH